MLTCVTISTLSRRICDYVNSNIDCNPIRFGLGTSLARDLLESLVEDINRYGFTGNYDQAATITIVLCEIPEGSVYDVSNITHMVLAYIMQLYNLLDTDHLTICALHGASLTVDYK